MRCCRCCVAGGELELAAAEPAAAPAELDWRADPALIESENHAHSCGCMSSPGADGAERTSCARSRRAHAVDVRAPATRRWWPHRCRRRLHTCCTPACHLRPVLESWTPREVLAQDQNCRLLHALTRLSAPGSAATCCTPKVCPVATCTLRPFRIPAPLPSWTRAPGDACWRHLAAAINFRSRGAVAVGHAPEERGAHRAGAALLVRSRASTATGACRRALVPLEDCGGRAVV